LCRRCLNRPPNFIALRSWARYEGSVREAIRRLKYRRNISLGLILAKYLSNLVDNLGWGIDLVIPVPLGVARLRERGYNQTVLIARPFALETGLPYSARGLNRVRETRSQVGLSYDQRQHNVKDAFEADTEIVDRQRILVIDDVTTSGATLNSCGNALIKAGAKEVYAITLARA
jgi:ComF family protein